MELTIEDESKITAKTPKSSFSFLSQLCILWPFILSIAFGRAGTIVVSYGSYINTDQGLFTDGGTLIVLSIMAASLPFFAKKRLGKRRVRLMAMITIGLDVACLSGLIMLEIVGISEGNLRFVLSTGVTFFGMVSLCYWLRRIRGTTPLLTAGIIFSSLIISEIQIYFCAIIPTLPSYLITICLLLFQYVCIYKARTKTRLLMVSSNARTNDYFGYAKSLLSSKEFLIVTAAGIGLLSIVIGFLRGYPVGDPIAFTPVTRVAYMFLTIAIFSLIIIALFKGSKLVMSLGSWIIMQGLACTALLAYAAFPANLEIGAVFTTSLNAMLVGFSWYIIVAFMSYGWRDPYYYAFSGHIVWLGCRAVARIALMSFYPLVGNDMFIAIVISALLLFSAQVVYIQYISITNNESKNELEKTRSRKTALETIMGLDKGESLSDVRQSYMNYNAEEIGNQFLLSEREVEVLTLYALGFTQKRVAEELHISQGTVHTHIKRIYTKTGMHSRQALLDYIKQYTA